MRYRVIAARETGGDGFTPRRRITREWVAEFDHEPVYLEPVKLPGSPSGPLWFVIRWRPAEGQRIDWRAEG